MDRSIGMERTFVLGQYKNIKLSDYISNIPEDILGNNDAMNALRLLQILHVDSTYMKYLKKSVTMRGIDYHNNPQLIEEVIEGLDKAKVTTFENFMVATANVHTTKDVEQGE